MTHKAEHKTNIKETAFSLFKVCLCPDYVRLCPDYVHSANCIFLTGSKKTCKARHCGEIHLSSLPVLYCKQMAVAVSC